MGSTPAPHMGESHCSSTHHLNRLLCPLREQPAQIPELCEAEEQKRPHGVAWTLTAALGASQQLSTHSPGLALFLESIMDSSSQA